MREGPAQKERYNTLLAASGALAAGKQIYLELDQPNKFLIRNDDLFWGNSKINLYKKVASSKYRIIIPKESLKGFGASNIEDYWLRNLSIRY